MKAEIRTEVVGITLKLTLEEAILLKDILGPSIGEDRDVSDLLSCIYSPLHDVWMYHRQKQFP